MYLKPDSCRPIVYIRKQEFLVAYEAEFDCEKYKPLNFNLLLSLTFIVYYYFNKINAVLTINNTGLTLKCKLMITTLTLYNLQYVIFTLSYQYI